MSWEALARMQAAAEELKKNTALTEEDLEDRQMLPNQILAGRGAVNAFNAWGAMQPPPMELTAGIPGEAPRTLSIEPAFVTGAIGPINAKEAAYFKKLNDRLATKGRNAWAPGFHEERYPHVQNVQVKMPDGEIHLDAIKGMNKGHALQRARWSWEGLDVEPFDGSLWDPPKSSRKR